MLAVTDRPATIRTIRTQWTTYSIQTIQIFDQPPESGQDEERRSFRVGKGTSETEVME